MVFEMKNKMYILIAATVLAIITFGISTFMQKKLIHYEASVACLILNKDINENELVNRDDFRVVNIPISIVATQKIVTNFEEIEGLYARDNIKAGQIAIRKQFDTKENLSIYEVEEGKEKISIKIKSAENGMSFQLKEKSLINVYATMRNEYANGFMIDKERMQIGDEYEGYTIIKLLENVEVLGTFTVDGVQTEYAEGENIDSLLISVTPEEAKQINLIREIATFNITGINNNVLAQEYVLTNEENKIVNISGDET